MAVKIRLRRTGAKHQPSYRVVIADSRSPRDGRFIETIGHYNPRRHDEQGQPELYIDPDRALYWLDHGAQPTETAQSLLRRARILELRHDRNHGFDVAERLAAMRRVPLKEPVAVAAMPAAAASPEPAPTGVTEGAAPDAPAAGVAEASAEPAAEPKAEPTEE